MRSTMRHALIIAGQELGELWRERVLMGVAAMFTLGFPSYLGWIAAYTKVKPSNIPIWGLEASFEPIFLAAMMMVHVFIKDRDQGTLPPLLATPLSNLSLFAGKALPVIFLGVTQGCGAYLVFVSLLWLKAPLLLRQTSLFAMALLPVLVLCATLVVSGVCISLASRIRSVRSATLALTFCSLLILLLEGGLGLWLMLDPLGRSLAPDTVATQIALGLATLAIASGTYRREQIIEQL